MRTLTQIKKGFTLIEMMMVLFIISLIIAIAFPGVNKISRNNKIAKAKAGLRSLQVAVENYYLNHQGSYPPSLMDLTTASPQVIKSLPLDPFSPTNGDYGYLCSPSAKHYVIFSCGPLQNGSAAVNDSGVLTENNESSCIYVSNLLEDSRP